MKTGWEIAGGEVKTFRVSLKEPFITALGRKTDTVNVGLHLRLRNGAAGYGEASGSIVWNHLKPERMERELRDELRLASGRDIRRLYFLLPEIRRRRKENPPVAAAFECAALEALAGAHRLRLADWFGGAKTDIESGITIPAGSSESAGNAAHIAAQEGFHAFKIKVGTTPRQDIERVRAVRDASQKKYPGSELLLDGNQGMSPSQALRFIELCGKENIRPRLFEQPVSKKDLKGMVWLKKRSSVPVAADESLASVEDAVRLLDADAADVFNIKIAKTGIRESLEIMALVRSAGKKLMIGCMRETARGLSASVHLACGTGAFDFIDLDSDHLLSADQPQGTFERKGPRLTPLI